MGPTSNSRSNKKRYFTAQRFIMDLQAEKFRLIEWLVQVQDVQILKQIGELKRRKAVADYEAQLKPMTMGELKTRLHASMEDVVAGRVHTLEEVMKEFE